MGQYGFFFDNTRCTGCKTCFIACQDYYNTPVDIGYRHVYTIEGGTWRMHNDGSYNTDCFCYFLSLSCLQCNKPACVEVCPTQAMQKDTSTGVVKIDRTRCIGCGFCSMSCPYNAVTVDKEVGCAIKCEACYQRVENNQQPVCVMACPLRALKFGDIDELRAEHGAVSQIYPMPNPSMTEPNITIKAAPATKLPEIISTDTEEELREA